MQTVSTKWLWIVALAVVLALTWAVAKGSPRLIQTSSNTSAQTQASTTAPSTGTAKSAPSRQQFANDIRAMDDAAASVNFDQDNLN